MDNLIDAFYLGPPAMFLRVASWNSGQHRLSEYLELLARGSPITGPSELLSPWLQDHHRSATKIDE